jgi:hypothetical protein
MFPADSRMDSEKAPLLPEKLPRPQKLEMTKQLTLPVLSVVSSFVYPAEMFQAQYMIDAMSILLTL